MSENECTKMESILKIDCEYADVASTTFSTLAEVNEEFWDSTNAQYPHPPLPTFRSLLKSLEMEITQDDLMELVSPFNPEQRHTLVNETNLLKQEEDEQEKNEAAATLMLMKHGTPWQILETVKEPMIIKEESSTAEEQDAVRVQAANPKHDEEKGEEERNAVETHNVKRSPSLTAEEAAPPYKEDEGPATYRGSNWTIVYPQERIHFYHSPFNCANRRSRSINLDYFNTRNNQLEGNSELFAKSSRSQSSGGKSVLSASSVASRGTARRKRSNGIIMKERRQSKKIVGSGTVKTREALTAIAKNICKRKSKPIEINESRKKKPMPISPTYTCARCGKWYWRKGNLVRHEKVHLVNCESK